MIVTVARVAPPKFRAATFEDHGQIAALETHYGMRAKRYEE
jgi:hypothetical protein